MKETKGKHTHTVVGNSNYRHVNYICLLLRHEKGELMILR